ncbi:glycosyltransferase family 4 protein [Candidatus Saccharibacteria bacterium]|jgi:glycosyltransferase involved in cell wall biosynthesis|nr:glycosyltransferase family 4 protein [Candidatus Saccharibacteria bacterium]HOR23074.1 glycosyltransferase family 1 protein [Candidatus Saccharibacteria bacterium]
MKSKIKVVFDANPLAVPNKTGVGMYTHGLIKNLAKNYPSKIELVGYYYNFLRRKKPVLPAQANIRYKPIYCYPGALVNFARRLGIKMPVEVLARMKADVCLFPNFLTQPSLFNTPSVPVVHDLSFIDLPEFAADKNRKDLIRFLPKILLKSAKVITVSEVSKNTIVDKFKCPASKVLVTHIPPEPPTKFTKKEVARILAKLKVSKPYILFIGTLEPRKNLINLLKAYEESSVLNSQYSLVIAGGTDWKFEEIMSKIRELKNKNLNIVHTGYLKIKERNALYSQAEVFVLPSHYEGFGMPILEAMSYKVPVCLSNIPVFHEVAGDAAIYFDKDSPKDIALKIHNCIFEEARRDLVEKGQNQLKKYNWKDVSAAVYKSLISLI